MISKKSVIVDSKARDNDSRGEILSIVDDKISNVSIITCYSNTIRSNHYHIKDFHYMHVLDGEIDYFFKEVDSKKINYLKIKKGENIFTPPNEIHATYFPVQTTLIVSSLNPRDSDTYEKDTVRVDFINHDNINNFLKEYS
tara:strand:- start:3314 stop:3736 length:423 start_codon:yes stop_codon:yes gene_type:complete